MGLLFGHAAAGAREGERQQSFEIGRSGIEGRLGDTGGKVLESFVFGDEVGLGVDLDDHPAVFLAGGNDHAFGRDPPRLLGGGR